MLCDTAKCGAEDDPIFLNTELLIDNIRNVQHQCRQASRLLEHWCIANVWQAYLRVENDPVNGKRYGDFDDNQAGGGTQGFANTQPISHLVIVPDRLTSSSTQHVCNCTRHRESE